MLWQGRREGPVHEVRELRATGPEPDLCLKALLSDALLLFEQELFIATRARVREVTDMNGDREIDATLTGLRLEAGGRTAGHDIKAVTYHELTFERGDDGCYRATVVFDI